MKHNNDEHLAQKSSGFVFSKGKIFPKLKVRRVDFILILLAFLLYIIISGFVSLNSKPTSGYVHNPVTKAVLTYKTLDYVKDNYPDFKKDAAVNINTGMLKSQAGYTVTCHNEDDTMSKITVYFDRKFNITKVAVNIKSQS